jgi:hypothetical protein
MIRFTALGMSITAGEATRSRAHVKAAPHVASLGDVASIPSDLFAKSQTSFYADPTDAMFTAWRLEQESQTMCNMRGSAKGLVRVDVMSRSPYAIRQGFEYQDLFCCSELLAALETESLDLE